MTHHRHSCGDRRTERTGHGAGYTEIAADHEGAPILVEVTRGQMVESRHRGHAVITDAAGHVVAHWGDFERLVYPRSAVKPLQAMPLIETGAADAFELGDEEIALACASHSGETIHTERVAAWLGRIGCTVADLECGPHPPVDPETAAALIRSGRMPTALHNNCSGKHTGFLTTARFKGESMTGYRDFAHPVQQRVLGVLEQMTVQDLGVAPRGLDGCSIPTFGVSLGGLALAMARLANPRDLPTRRAEAALRIRHAWSTRPDCIAGRNRFDTDLIRSTGGKVLTKGGAEGVHCACLPETGLGIALKIEDGAGRAAEVAMAALLRQTGALDALPPAALARFLRPRVRTMRGQEAGEIHPAPSLSA